jgi:YVTN family beta-propeller protein
MPWTWQRMSSASGLRDMSAAKTYLRSTWAGELLYTSETTFMSFRKSFQLAFSLPLALLLSGCHRLVFPVYPSSYREFAYVTSGAGNSVTVLDLVNLRLDRTLQVGRNPTGLSANPVRNEVYAVNTDSNSVSVIDVTTNRVVATIGVHDKPYFIEVSPDGKRAYVPNSGSNTVSVIDLDRRREIAVAATGEGPGVAKLTGDGKTLVVSNRTAGSISIYSVSDSEKDPLHLREAYPGCAGATDIAIAANYAADPSYGSKAFVACSGGHQVMDVWLEASPTSWRGQQDPSLQHDQLLAMLDVGRTPTHLSLKPDLGEVFSTNFGSDSISEISVFTNEVTGTYIVGGKPSRAIMSKDDSSLWITNFGADTTVLYSVDDGRLVTGVQNGSGPDALAFCVCNGKDEHMILVVNSGSGSVDIIRNQAGATPALFTMLPVGPHPNDIVVKAFTEK